jgi:predicted GNAT family acetyltransferase
MKSSTIQSAQEFLEVAGDRLLTDEIRHNLTFGIAERISQNAHVFGADDPWFITVEDREQICATAIRTPPHRVILSYFSGDLARVSSELAVSIHRLDPIIPGVVGDKEIAESFTQRWCASYSSEVQNRVAQRIYQLTALVEPEYAEGRLRQAIIDDAEIVITWAAAFHEEAVGDVLPRDHYQRYRERIQQGDIYLWDNAAPMSMAARTRPTRSGISIGGVYTPPENRNRGYATSCVAALCKRLLPNYDFCVLYTDLSNPTSNSIYQKIGFREYCDSVQYSYAQQTE